MTADERGQFNYRRVKQFRPVTNREVQEQWNLNVKKNARKNQTELHCENPESFNY